MLPRMQCDILLQCGRAIAALLAEMESEAELFASANTRAGVEAHLLVMAQTLAHFPPALQRRLLRVDWAGWQALQLLLEADGQPRREEVWYGVSSLMPATLYLISELRRRNPAWFEISY